MPDLHGLRVLITRPRNQTHAFAALLRGRGAIAICFPVIEISPLGDYAELDAALARLQSYDWLVFTSVNGATAVCERMANLGIKSPPESLRIAAIGPKTAKVLEQRGIMPDLVPEEYVAEAILPRLGELRGRRVLLARADIGRTNLAEGIRAMGGRADDISVYQTIPAQMDLQGLREIRAGLDIVTFTSASTVTNFIHLTRLAGLDSRNLPGKPLFACIGPISAMKAKEHQLPVAAVAREYTVEGLISAIEALDVPERLPITLAVRKRFLSPLYAHVDCVAKRRCVQWFEKLHYHLPTSFTRFLFVMARSCSTKSHPCLGSTSGRLIPWLLKPKRLPPWGYPR